MNSFLLCLNHMTLMRHQLHANITLLYQFAGQLASLLKTLSSPSSLHVLFRRFCPSLFPSLLFLLALHFLSLVIIFLSIFPSSSSCHSFISSIFLLFPAVLTPPAFLLFLLHYSSLLHTCYLNLSLSSTPCLLHPPPLHPPSTPLPPFPSSCTSHSL